MFGLFKKKKEAPKTQDTQTGSKQVLITEDTIVYKEPGIGGATAGALTKGMKIPFISESEGWVQGKLPNGTSVWIPHFECRVI